MDLVEYVKHRRPEDGRIDYKAKQAPWPKVAKNLASFANANGGTVVVGVPEEDGHPKEPQNIKNPHSIADEIFNTISSCVSPIITPERTIEEIEGRTILGLTVNKSERLHSVTLNTDQPVFPIRHGPQTRYLSGEEVSQRLQAAQSKESIEEDEKELLRLPDESLEDQTDAYFIEAPDGHISDICLFSNIYHPEHPERIVLRDQYITEQKAEHIFACLDALFDISIGDANFTINESNGAWVGKGYYNFVANLRSRQERYHQVIEDGYELEFYGNEQAVLIADLDMVYPESVLILYAAPFDNQDGYRYLTINLLIEGKPVDVRPLIEFEEKAGLKLSTAEEVEIDSDGLMDPSRIPVEVIERTRRPSPIGDGSEESIDGAFCLNPFYGKTEFLEQSLDIPQPRPISKYQKLYAFLHDWDDPENPSEYETQRFVVSDWNEYTRGMYANIKEIQFDINW